MWGFERTWSKLMYAGITAAIGGAMLSGCSGSAVNKAEFDKIKTAAVLVYTVPEVIEFRSDPKETKKSLLQQVAAAAASGNASRAATLSHETFSANLNGKLPFRVLTADEVRNNAAYNALNPTKFAKKSKLGDGTMGKLLAFAGAKDGTAGVGPDGMPQFGMVGYGQNPAEGQEEQTKYLVAAMQALNVDAAIVVNDPGYSFGCYACVGGTGDGTTGSAFTTALVNKDGKLIGGVYQWFGVSGGHAPVVGYIVNPLQHESLFKTHGEKMAAVYIEQLQEDGAIPGKKK